jgi:DNA polymerase-3 subunit delta
MAAMTARPITLVVSGDEFLASAAVARIRAEHESAGFSIEEHSGDVQPLLYALDTPSLFGEGRLVIVRDADALTAAALQRIAEWAASEPEGVRLALTGSGAKIKKALSGVADVVAETAPPPWEVPRWVVARVRARKRQISPEAAQALVDAVGHDLRELSSAIDQLLTATQGPVDVPAVHSLFRGLESQVWVFVDTVMDRDRRGGLRHLHALLGQGEHPLVLVAALARQMRTIAAVRGRDRVPAAAIAKDLGVKEGSVKRAFRQVRRFDDTEIRRAFRLLADADLSLKGGDTGFEDEPPEMVMELLVAGITGERAPSSARR